jgi:hypothetical protein
VLTAWLASLGERARGALGLLALCTYGIALGRFGLPLWHDAILLPLLLWFALAMTASYPARHRTLFALATLTLAPCLFYVWNVGHAGRHHVFAGLFALSDAGEYYADAERFLHGDLMNSGGARRPLFSLVLGAVLRVFSNSVHLTHVVTLLAWAGSFSFASTQVWRTHGRRVASAVFILLMLFARRYVGFVQSEGLGAPLGALAFGLFWQIEHGGTRRNTPLWMAMALLSLALLARPGPIFVIPAFVLWAVRRAKPSARVKTFIVCVSAIVCAVLVQAAVRTSTSAVVSYSDLPPILYGLLHNEDAWYITRANPLLATLSPNDAVPAMWALLRAEALARPGAVMLAALRCFASWFYLPQGFFGVVWLNPDDRVLESAHAVRDAMAHYSYAGPIVLWGQKLGIYSLVNALAMAAGGLLFVLGFVRAIARNALTSKGVFNLQTMALVGVGVSLPFLPPWITEGAQILASVIAFPIVFTLVDVLRASSAHHESSQAPEPSVVYGLNGIAIALGVVALAVVATKFFPSHGEQAFCDERHPSSHLYDLDRASLVSFGTPGADITPARSLENLELLTKVHAPIGNALRAHMGEPNDIILGYDLCERQAKYILAPHGVPAFRNARWEVLKTDSIGAAPFEKWMY